MVEFDIAPPDAESTETRIDLLSRTGEVVRDIDVVGLPGADFYEVEWSPDGNGFYVVADFPRGVALVRVDLRGEAHVLHEDQTGFFFSIKPSPDGRHLAFEKATVESNAWMIEKF